MEKIKRILIVGGGSSGWMTAASLCKNIPDIDITVIHSPNIPTIGVGESTILHINRFLNNLELVDEDWMQACNATYKTSIDFTNFCGDGKRVSYPFGEASYLNKYEPFDWFLKQSILGADNEEYVDFAMGSSELIKQNKLTKDDPNIIGWDFNNHTAYHMDAELFGRYLKAQYCIPQGVKCVLDDVVEIKQNEDGSIQSITTNEHGDLSADLFVDCTGFKSLLLDKTLKEPFNSFKDKLINDKAVATRLKYKDIDVEMEHRTNATTMNSGWVWNIPLWNRIGTGYVYSSQFLTEQEAEKEFGDFLINDRDITRSQDEVEQCEMMHVNIRPGIHSRSWVKNVCAIGLSNGFIEPLESTGLMLTNVAIFELVKTLQSRSGRVNRYDKDIFNSAVRRGMSNFSGFIAGHYALAERDDTPYWKYVTEEIQYMNDDSPEWKWLTTYLPSTSNSRSSFWNNLPDTDGAPYIMSGFGYNPVDITLEPTGVYNDMEKLQMEITSHKKAKKDYIKNLPSHYQFLKDTIYQGME